ncbi:hypothetical protein OIV83_000795 [Microbotryomycetes sp. JL201]|nr:hypothetical protein OIV83_000795 [Microbotryomycetes sp. JL201]
MSADRLPPPRIDLLVHAPHYSVLVPVLEQLLEPSPPLRTQLAPQLHQALQADSRKPKSYHELLYLAQDLVKTWDVQDQALFLGSHPRIGETSGLSKLSSQEQGPKQGQQQTPSEVMRRLATLNMLYEEAYPGLRFITFVNGRPRVDIIPEIESALDLFLPKPSVETPEPRIQTLRERVRTNPAGSAPWRKELERGLQAMWDIAHDRLNKLGLN